MISNFVGDFFFQILWPTQNIWTLYRYTSALICISYPFLLVSKKIKPDISRSKFGQCCSGHDGSLVCLSQQFFWVGLSGNDIVDKIDCTVVVWGDNSWDYLFFFFAKSFNASSLSRSQEYNHNKAYQCDPCKIQLKVS